MQGAAVVAHTNDLCVQKLEMYCSRAVQNGKK